MRYYYVIGSGAQVYEFDKPSQAAAQKFARRVLAQCNHKIQVFAIDRVKRQWQVTFWVVA